MSLPDSASAVSWKEMQAFFPHRRIANHIRPLPDEGVVYVKNPKAGCSTILVWLDRIHTGEFDHVFTNVHKQHRLPDVRRSVGRRSCGCCPATAYRFSFVRNPVRRFESVYWDKIVHKRHRWRSGTGGSLAMEVEPGGVVSFEQFLTAVEHQDPLSEMDPHWRPQHINLMHPLVTYDRVGRLEDFDAELEIIREEAGLPQVPHQVRNPSKKKASDSVFANRPDLLRRVEQIYAEDMELYGY